MSCFIIIFASSAATASVYSI